MTAPADRLSPVLTHHIVNTLGWRSLRPLQEHAIGPVLDGDDAVLLAPTAGGKTGPRRSRCCRQWTAAAGPAFPFCTCAR